MRRLLNRIEPIPHCATCAHWERPADLSTVGGCSRVPKPLRWWRWLYETDAHDGCLAHDQFGGAK